jgi:uncharacterized protein (DUF924 family)
VNVPVHDSVTAEDVLSFWFESHGPKDWFGGMASFDQVVVEGFLVTHGRAVANELVSWRTTPAGRLAELIVLDQFSRQIYRRQARAFASDGQALALAQELVLRGDDLKIEEARRRFAYMPYMHSESRVVQDESVRLFSAFDEEAQRYARDHRALIVRFGRYPHRNATLGRESTAAEQEYLSGNHESYGQ